MPELPEVETLCRQLKKVILGNKILALTIYDAKIAYFPEMIDRNIKDVRRRGKGLEIDLGGTIVHLHLRMSGRLFWQTDCGLPPQHTRYRIEFAQGRILCIDPRRFATLDLRKDDGEGKTPIPDLLAGINPDAIRLQAQRRRLPIKAFLLDQQVMPGMGNIYACEILFESSINPWRPTCDVTPEEWRKIVTATGDILKLAVTCRGTSISDWRDLFGEKGEYQHRLKVYGQEGKTCPRCHGQIERQKLSGRGTYYCPSCQK
ncbi:MAG: bifunctional DNA-formamidopyrimidine glycosylase/DNA-(apurinic or apyrimidinic site) lyase [Syntrophales bacterium]